MKKVLLFCALSAVYAACGSSAEQQVVTDAAEASVAAEEVVPARLIHSEDVQTLAIGSQAPDFSLPGIDGKTYSLQDFNDSKALAVIFTCNHCPTAQAYEDRMIQLAKDYKHKGVALVAVSPNDPLAVRLDELGYSDMNDTFEEMQQRAKDKGYNFLYLYDGETQAMSAAYGPVATPHAFVFDQDRKLQYAGRLDASEKPGSANAEDLRRALDAVLAGRAVPEATTKTFGCSVKWSGKRGDNVKTEEKWAAEAAGLELIDKDAIRRLVTSKSENLRLINVWATWCGPCVSEFPDFVDMSRMYGGREFELITISADKPEKKDKVLKFLNDKNAAASTNYLFSEEDKYALIEAIDPDWQGALPYTILLKPNGEKVYAKQGTIDPHEMKKAIVEQLGRYY
ncbi:redoxin domain-containing protein [Cesiribacter sp. SM1]|uniref:redoxin domain-containing protein n=1 Tax=Cesiribacter sp. SM1 TaxID=2861196 RepID=UPI001CD64A20|nr:redoxin domain-containing protein [Cesiribacter sp. SM1]